MENEPGLIRFDMFREEALLRQWEYTLNVYLKEASSHECGFSMSDIDGEQDCMIPRLYDREFYEWSVSDCFHRNWDTIDEGRKSLACIYEQTRLRLFAVSHLNQVFLNLWKRGEYGFHSVTIAPFEARVGRHGLNDFSGANGLSIAKAVSRLRENNGRPAIFGVHGLSGVDTDGRFHWQANVRLIITGVPKESIELAFWEYHHRDDMEIVELREKDNQVQEWLYKICEFKPDVITSGTALRVRTFSKLEGKDLARWTAWMGTQSFRHMVIALGMPKGTRAAILRRPLWDIVTRCAVSY
jgi:hypothetical protein